MLESSLSENLRILESEITLACKHFGRRRRDVSLIAVSKGHDFSSIKEAHALGLKDFGENYAQEFLAKFNEGKASHLDLRWHFIGNIQSNKLGIIAQADAVHSIASWRHAKLLDEILVKPMKGFLQVNLGPTDARLGFSSDEVLAMLHKPWPFKKLNFSGLMTILPLEPKMPAKHWFLKMAKLKEQVQNLGYEKVDLSMGMSDDFEEAIAHGANFIRVGTRIFGPRDYRSRR